MLEENKKLVRRYYELVAGDLAGIEAVVTDDFVDHQGAHGCPGGSLALLFLVQMRRGLSGVGHAASRCGAPA